MHKICNMIWRNRQWPTVWTKLVLVPIPKSGDLQDCNNYRNVIVSLICHASRVLLHIFLNRLRQLLWKTAARGTNRVSCWTRNERCTIYNASDHRKVNWPGKLRTVFDIYWPLLCPAPNRRGIKRWCCMTSVCLTSVCLTSVWHLAPTGRREGRGIPWRPVKHLTRWIVDIMLDMGIPRHLVESVAGLYNNQEAAVRWNGQLTAWFPIGQGTSQGCNVSPTVQPICRAHYENSRGELRRGGDWWKTNNKFEICRWHNITCQYTRKNQEIFQRFGTRKCTLQHVYQCTEVQTNRGQPTRQYFSASGPWRRITGASARL